MEADSGARQARDQLVEEAHWRELESTEQQAHLWRVLRERVLELTFDEFGYHDSGGEVLFPTGFSPFTVETDAFALFQYWDECVQIYKLGPKGDYLVQLVASTTQIKRTVGHRAPTVRQSLFRGTCEYMAKKRIKWRIET